MKLKGFEAELAKARARILEACMANDKQLAVRHLETACRLVTEADLNDAERKEGQCRLLESEIDIAEITPNHVRELTQVTLNMLRSQNFSDMRLLGVIERGLVRSAEASAKHK